MGSPEEVSVGGADVVGSTLTSLGVSSLFDAGGVVVAGDDDVGATGVTTGVTADGEGVTPDVVPTVAVVVGAVDVVSGPTLFEGLPGVPLEHAAPR